MKRLILLFVILFSMTGSFFAQTWNQEDWHDEQNRNDPHYRNQGWGQPRHNGWNQGNQGWDNPYQDPSYYPVNYGYGGCPPPPPPTCRRNMVVVSPPPTYCAPVVLAPSPYPMYRPYGFHAYRRPYGWGYRPRGWRYR